MIKATTLTPIAIVVATTLGIVLHDMHIDKATTYIVAPVVYESENLQLEKVITHTYHTHVEKASAPRPSVPFRSSLPKVKPPRDDSRRYVQTKKTMFMGGSDTVSLWPSV